MSRKQFIESHGATCKNWTWSWSFVNHSERFVIFGAWDRFSDGRNEMILAEGWKINRNGNKAQGYGQSREHLRLVEEKGYRLFTFPMKYSDELEEEDGTGPGKIGEFTPELRERKLTRVGDCWYAGDRQAVVPLAEEVPGHRTFPKGALTMVTINAFERNAKSRAACIVHHGVDCSVCGTNFGRAFGSLGEGFIHVHHVVPLSEVGEGYEVDPEKDLRPVCPNCHAMIHRVRPPLEINQLKEHLASMHRG